MGRSSKVRHSTSRTHHYCLEEVGNLHHPDGKAKNILSGCCNVLKKNDNRVPLLHLLYDTLIARSGIEEPQDDEELDAETDDDVENVSRHSMTNLIILQ